MVEGEAMYVCDVYTNDVYECGGITNRRSWVLGRSGRVHRLATLSFAKLLLCAQLPWQNSSEWTRTWSSCVAHITQAARIVPGGFRVGGTPWPSLYHM